MELKAALTSPDPEAFSSSLPIHQDGTCNGLQHYAALGGDARGAAQVNLAAGDRPSDVYTYVSDMVQKLVAQDAEKGDHNAKVLMGKITRKVVKQTVSGRCLLLSFALTNVTWVGDDYCLRSNLHWRA